MIPLIGLIPVIEALATGGVLVTHSSGGLIVANTVGSYVAGTFLSTTAVSSILGATGVAATGAAFLGTQSIRIRWYSFKCIFRRFWNIGSITFYRSSRRCNADSSWISFKCWVLCFI